MYRVGVAIPNFLCLLVWSGSPVEPPAFNGLPIVWAQVLEGTYDWCSWLSTLNAHLTGLFDSEGKASTVAHCLRIVQARDVTSHDLPVEAETVQRDYKPWAEIKPSPMDAVLLAKHRISDKQLMQGPLLMLPAEVAQRLDWKVVPIAPRNKLLTVAANNYLRTAKVISDEPWNQTTAGTYLRQWVKANAQQQWPAPIRLEVMQGGRPIPPQVGPAGGWRDFAPHEMRQASVAAPPPNGVA